MSYIDAIQDDTDKEAIMNNICDTIQELQKYSDEKDNDIRDKHGTSMGYTFGKLKTEKPEVLNKLHDLVRDYKRAPGVPNNVIVTNELDCEEIEKLEWPSKQFFNSFKTFINDVNKNARTRLKGGTKRGKKRTKRTKSRKQRRNR
jgi:hypothetical protein